jgi:prepilin-type N-terminal cleavage/methylation domain-containing protein
MEKMQKLNTKKGFTIIEMIIALVIISVILLVVVPVGQTAMDNSRISNAVASVKAIQTGAVNWANDTNATNGGVYTGITFAKLAAGYLPASFTATGTNPWNGNYTVAVDAGSATVVDVSLTGVPQSDATKLTNAMTKVANATPTYTAASLTWTIALN